MTLNKFNLSEELVYKFFISLGVIIVGYFFAFLIVRLINSKIRDFKRRHQARRYTYYLTTFLTIIITVFIWLERISSLSTFFGFLSAGLALALHQVLLNIAGWILIVLRRPFELSDRIEWGDISGDVIDIQVFYTTLLEVGNHWVDADQSTGRLVHIPNSDIFKKPLVNYTHGFEHIWNEIKVTITFESDCKKAQSIIETIAQEEGEQIQEEAKRQIQKMSKRYMIIYTKFSPITYVNIIDRGVEITLRYLTTTWGRRIVQSHINKRILERFKVEDDIDFAYPTWRVYNRDEDKARERKKEELMLDKN